MNDNVLFNMKIGKKLKEDFEQRANMEGRTMSGALKNLIRIYVDDEQNDNSLSFRNRKIMIAIKDELQAFEKKMDDKISDFCLTLNYENNIRYAVKKIITNELSELISKDNIEKAVRKVIFNGMKLNVVFDKEVSE